MGGAKRGHAKIAELKALPLVSVTAIHEAGHAAEGADSIIRTAIHEAGHAVIGRVLKLDCGSATIVPNLQENTAGHTFTAAPYGTLDYWYNVLHRFRGDEMRSIMRGRIMTFMAGAEAEVAFYGDCRGGDGDDRTQIGYMLESLLQPDADVPRYAARLRAFTRGLVGRHRVTIERVAALLIERRTLQPHDIEEVISSHGERMKEFAP